MRREKCQKREKVRWTVSEGAHTGQSLQLPGGRVSVLFQAVCKTSMTRPVGGHPVCIVSLIIRTVYLCHASALKMGDGNFSETYCVTSCPRRV